MTTTRSYGITESSGQADSLPITELRRQGYTILTGVLNGDQLNEARRRLDDVYAHQETEFGVEALVAINELHLARLPLAYDPWFVSLAANPSVLGLVRECLGSYVVLHLQNGILNMPDQVHHQSAWHRDLPYQEWTSSKPLALSALICIDPFTRETGGTHVLPCSHKFETLPPVDYVDKHAAIAEAPAGSVIIFDCMLFHRAGQNRSGAIRRGINHVYTIPLLRQQINIPQSLGGAYADEPELAAMLGYTSQVPSSVIEWREARKARLGSISKPLRP